MNKALLSGATLGLISVIMGALGDHAIQLTTDQMDSLNTAIRYNMIYAALICALALHANNNKALTITNRIFITGTSLFCLSIYAALLTGTQDLTYITPIGGLTLMIGWTSLIITAIKMKSLKH